MSEAQEKVYTLLNELWMMPHGDAQIAMAEEAVRHADLANDLNLQVSARFELISATIHGGESEKAIVAYSWCLKKYDENPEAFETYRFFWQYKWILNNIPNFPSVSRAQIDSIFEDAIRRYRQNGISLRPIYGERMSFEMRSGNPEKAAELYLQWLAEKRDFYADCRACETDRQVQYLIFCGRDEEALKVAEPILKGDELCAEIPHLTLGHLLLPLLRMGQAEMAAECFTKGYKLVSGNKDFLQTVARQIEFLALTGKTRKGVSLLERHLNWALETKDLDGRFHFYKSVVLLLDVIEKEKLNLRLPNDWKTFAPDGVYETKKLAADFMREAEDIARLFDRRNGNAFFAGQLKANEDLKSRFGNAV